MYKFSTQVHKTLKNIAHQKLKCGYSKCIELKVLQF